MSKRNQQWHEELNELLTEEASSHLARTRETLSKHRRRREARRKRRELKKEVRSDLLRDELDQELAKLALSELERRYSGVGGLPMAIVMALAALIALGFAVFNPTFFPLFFVAFGLGMGAAGIYSSHAKSDRMLGQLRLLVDGDEEVDAVEAAGIKPEPLRRGRRDVAPAQTAPAGDPLSQRLEAACDRLEQALGSAPDEVKRFLSTQSGKTLDQLRMTGRDLARRELHLRELGAAEPQSRIEADHAELEERIARASDDGVRQSLFQARTALQEKQAHHAQLVRGAERMEAERLRLAYTLEGLHAQILRLSTSSGLGSGVLTSPLRASLEQLQGELSALAEASDEVRRMADARLPEAIAEIADPSSTRDPMTGLLRERS